MGETSQPFSQAAASEWLNRHRYGGNPSHELSVRSQIERYIKYGVQLLNVQPNMTLLDVGCGDGMLGWHALENVQAQLQLIGVDIDATVVELARQQAQKKNRSTQCRFEQASATDLASWPAACADIVTTRACLAYVDDKLSALKAFAHVLKPGGQLLLIEPLFRDEALAAIQLRRLHEQSPDNEELTLMHLWKSAQYPDTAETMASCALTNYSERDLFAWVQQAGFTQTHLELHLDQRPARETDWDTFVAISPHLWAPTLHEVMQTRMSAQQQVLLRESLEPLLQANAFAPIDRILYLRAVKL